MQKLNQNKINIAIDGFSSCGKGTLARFIASKLNYIFIDSGAMYRAVTYYLQQKNINFTDFAAMERALPAIKIGFEKAMDSERSDVTLNGVNIEKKIRTMEVASQVSLVAKIPAVRKFLVSMQMEIGKHKGVVMDGRDIGTVVFPNAELKIFMTASAEVRAKRRFSELVQSGASTTYDEVLQNLRERDKIDSSRDDSPLTLTNEYLVLDNTSMSIDEQNAMAMQWVGEALGKNSTI